LLLANSQKIFWQNLTHSIHGIGLSVGEKRAEAKIQKFYSTSESVLDSIVHMFFRSVGGTTRLPKICERDVTMNSALNCVKNFLVSEDGPTAVEYAVMLALIVVTCLTAIKAIGTNANTKFGAVRDALT
jgi:pilus assembly protein Flp/PilA